MSPEVYAAFESICATESITDPVLEIGAADSNESLLRMKCLAGHKHKVGLNMEYFPSTQDIKMVMGNANAMDMFEDQSFGCVLCNATLEHDARFWITVSEIRRVLKPGGLVVIGVPGYKGMGPRYIANRENWTGKMFHFLARHIKSDEWMAGTLTLGEHFFPGDYYRFSEQAMREILLEGFEQVHSIWTMMPPRIIGWGRKPI